MSEWVQVSANVVKLTEKAALLEVEPDDEQVWVPLSQVRDPDVLEEGLEDVVEIKRWLADKNGWA